MQSRKEKARGIQKLCLSVGNYSGKGRPPMYGDYEAQRHWMEITYNLPINQWYVNSSDNDLLYWGLDYPPLTAYHSYVMGWIAHKINPDWVSLLSSRGIETTSHKIFMRISSILPFITIYVPILVVFFYRVFPSDKSEAQEDSEVKREIALNYIFGCIVVYPAMISVDNGHFQYNSISLGLFLWSVFCLITQRLYAGSVLFVLALNYKQMELYHSLPVFIFILSRSIRKPLFGRILETISSIAKVGGVVITVFGLLWAPFFWTNTTRDVLLRIFPFNRGIYEDKVASVWCAFSFILKRLPNSFQQWQFFMSTFLVLLFSLPSLLVLFLQPSQKNFRSSLFLTSLSFYLFSFQVHEKTILLPAVSVILLALEFPLEVFWFLNLSNISIFPLCVKDGNANHIVFFFAYFIATQVTGRFLLGRSLEKIPRRMGISYPTLQIVSTLCEANDVAQESLSPTPQKQFRLKGEGLPGGEMQLSKKRDAAVAENAASIQANTSSSVSESIAAATAIAPSVSSSIISGTFESLSSHHQDSLPVNDFPTDENDHKYVGLVNQAMTCYLNSLVQSLYMTPEFRNAMYRWEYRSAQASKRGESSIPCQLQKLFLLLQTSDADALETRDLTASFGWTASEAYDQHDVQELCRLMFDALELKWKGTEHEKLIQDLYRGTMQDFVKCLKCGRENVRPDFFLDLPLAVKPFGAMNAFKSVEEALQAFVAPELLDGSNQYHCECCKSKQDAHKGLRVTHFPYLLTIQLKRFDFDYNTMHRIKLNDKMTFPDILDLNSFVHRADDDSTKEKETDVLEKGSAVRSADESMQNESLETPEEDFAIDSSAFAYSTQKQVKVGQRVDQICVDELLKGGEYVYELFSVMVHSGSAAGGHYFAYIKNMEQDRWYCFNDARVEFASDADIERSFGGHSGGWNNSNTNAYMLMYRKVDRTRNSSFMHTEKLPRHIISLQEKWRQQEVEAEKERILQQSLLSVRVQLNLPLHSVLKRHDNTPVLYSQVQHHMINEFSEYITEISRTQHISNVFNQAFNYFQERANSYGLQLSRNNCRLIYCRDRMTMEKSLCSKAQMDKPIKTLFDSLGMDPPAMSTVWFFLDYNHNGPSESFPIEPYGGRSIFLQRVDIGMRCLLPPFRIYVPPNMKIVELKHLVGKQFRDDARSSLTSRLVMECTKSRSEFLLLDPSRNGTSFMDCAQTFVGNSFPTLYYDGGFLFGTNETARSTQEDREKFENNFAASTMFELLDRKHFSMLIRVRFPSAEELNRAASSCGAYSGPTWAETIQNIPEAAEAPTPDDPIWGEPQSSACDNAPIDMEEDPYVSGRGSANSMFSVNVDDVRNTDVDFCDQDRVSGSFCNNTPQMSPSVSEGDDFDMNEGALSSIELRNQLNAERTISYMSEQLFEAASPYVEDEQNKVPVESSLSKVRSLRPAFTNEDNMSESAGSSGHSTVVPTAVALPPTDADSLGGKILQTSVNENYRVLDVDNRTSFGDFKSWMASQMQVECGQFVIVKHSSEDGNDSGYETTSKDDETLFSAFSSSSMLSVKLRPPLKHDEKLVQIYQFDMNDYTKENWRMLFECPASPRTLIGDVLLQCIRFYKEIYGTALTPQQVRLRDLPNYGSGHNVLRPNDAMSKRSSWCSNMYMQIVSDPAVLGKCGDPILVRRFRPSTVEVSQTHEVLVDPNAENQVLSFMEALANAAQIPLERVAITDIASSAWEKWPYLKNRLDMLDGKVCFLSEPQKLGLHQKDFIERVGSRVIYYKDLQEEPKVLTEEERKQITIKENGQTAIANRRKERPLRIQMSSVCEP
ncbi:unnamed protein product [Caenorhabditis auriculariae]|uniref:Ubiquitin carboxyl-terminal hydrolase 47 n=1 Tax=Caenorhabditis auriculariae TaxID=2777116 RepID=A0A8S1HHR8_9PELO|nr:unnamed protein product [Caenorhabditis auriculariae]